jgi:TrmH family RNA methyltransferase
MPRMSDSADTPLKPLKWYKKLATDKGRLEAGAFLIEGDRAIRQVIASQPDAIIDVVTVNDLPLIYHRYPIRFVTESQFRSICQTKTPQGPLAVAAIPPGIYSDRLPNDVGNKILLLENIQDPGNVGTLIRTAAAFDISGVILTDKCADPFSPKCVQATAGTLLSLWLRRTNRYLELVEALRRKGYYLVAADLNGADDQSILRGRDKLLLALGNEAAGLSKKLLELSDYRFRIPIVRRKAESLNVAVCGAICMYLSSLK